MQEKAREKAKILILYTHEDLYEFWNDIINLPADKKEIINKKNVSFAEKIALFDCNIWPKLRYIDDQILANHQREIGNDFFRSMQFKKAIIAYNMCLYYSTLESRGILFANRSAAYLALRSYKDCLESARLAKKYPLPHNTMIKLLAREKMAIEGLRNEQVVIGVDETDLPIELTYRRNKRMPSFVFCLKLKDARNPYGGIITTENLLPGDVLVVEPRLTQFTRFYPLCDYCAVTSGSLQLCNCECVMFCSLKCKEKAFEEYHNFECPLMDHLSTFSGHDCVVFRVFFKLIQRFKDVASLREYLENIKNPNPFDDATFKAWSDPGSFESQFRLYYATERPSMINCTVRKNNLFRTDIENKHMNTSMAKTAIMIEMLKACKQIPHITGSTEDWSFLSELMFQLIIFKSFAIMNVPVMSEFQYVQDDLNGIEIESTADFHVTAAAVHGSASLFRTSCQRNVDMTYATNLLIVRALTYIPRGTELLAANVISNLNAFSLRAWFPSMSFDLSRSCFCEECFQWFHLVSNLGTRWL